MKTESIIVENLSKCYLLSKKDKLTPGTWSGLLSLFGAKPDNKKYTGRDLWALKDISFSVKRGQAVGIIGRNGAGKTTLLKVLSRITPPTRGRALLKGRVVSLLELGAGVDPTLSGRDNIFLNAAFYGIKKDDISRECDEIVSFAELEKFIDVPVRHYSSGMYLRLAFSIAIHMRPDILLADEVLAVGDLGFQKRCMSKLEEIGKTEVTVLIVSHDMELIRRMCGTCMRLDDGTIVDLGIPEEVTRRYQDEVLSGSTGKNQSLTKAGKVNNHNVIANKYCEIISVQLLSDVFQEIGVVRVSQDFFVKWRFKAVAGNVGLRPVIDIITNGIHVFRTLFPTDLDVTGPQVFETLTHVPKNLLAETNYSINVGIIITKEKRITFLYLSHALTFQVYDTGEAGSARGDFNRRIPGVIRPQLNWKLVKVN